MAKIFLVSLGPGAPEYMSVRAQQALCEAEIVIGYHAYIELCKPLLTGQTVIASGMTEEIARCKAAYAYAQQGCRVALVSSGDIGIYALASLAYEIFLQAGWRPGDAIAVELIPGISALSASAALVGAPLAHDFCAISLSDLLTPWAVIAKRLQAAAQADYVIALYNPKSRRRTEQINEAQRIIAQYRQPETPVMIVQAAYRSTQNIDACTLADLQSAAINMQSLVLIGNSQSYMQDGLMLTPRGYAHKYNISDERSINDERPGHSLRMGLDGWKNHFFATLKKESDAKLEEITEAIEMPIGMALDLIFRDAAKEALNIHATPISLADQAEILAIFQAWGRVDIKLPHQGLTGCLSVNASDFKPDKNQIAIENESMQISVDMGRIHSAWLLRAPMGEIVYAIDQKDALVFSAKSHPA
ncbi:precorrin-3B C(17)-methyltransferase [Thiorhodospira sibirica]|uniref:precorrin-3B C(17)-methyltransferase n=1 Tax=Thiorhodospira sibirica TaxID=154347 RepID=UPI00022C4C6F|nr:precorrin-3B C(17)-methyltransferase [Thiorhodospira sibirica]